MNTPSKQVTFVSAKDVVDAHKKRIDQASEEYISGEIGHMAANYAVMNLPGEKDSSIEDYIGPIRGFFSTLASETALDFGSAIRQQLAALEVYNLRSKIKDLRLKINARIPQIETLKADRKKIVPPKSAQENQKVKTLFNIWTAIEVLSFIGIFISFRDNILLSIIMGLLFGTSFTVGIKSLVLYLRDGAGRALSLYTKRFIWSSVALAAIVMGILRFWLVKSNGNSPIAHSPIAPFIFCILSLFLIGVLALFVAHHYPTPAEEALILEAANLNQEIAQKEQELKECETQCKQYEEDCNTIGQIHTQLMQAEKDFYPRIESCFQKAVGVFKYQNRINRKDNISPSCFSHPVEPLQLPEHSKWDSNEFSHSTNNL